MADEASCDYLDPGDLLDANGALVQSGYAFSQVKAYSRDAVRHRRLRIKEWDYYCFCDGARAVALTVADNSYMSLGSVSVLDFSHFSYITKSKMGFMPKGRLRLPPGIASGDVAFEKGGVKLNFYNDNGKRRLCASFPRFDGKLGFECELLLSPPTGDNITMATPFVKPRQFYYNTKVNCLTGTGWYTIGEEKHEFRTGTGVLDWGRGVWPYKNVWYWSSLSTDINGTPFGFNLGYGFGCPPASENVIFYDGRAHKLNNVKFDIPFTLGKLDYLKPWKIADDAGRLELMFYPMIDRRDKTNALVISTDQHQVFGKFYGKATLDDGSIVDITDKLGFAEHVKNKW